jgi:hypothetical protein
VEDRRPKVVLLEHDYRTYLLGEFCLQFSFTELLLHQTVQHLAKLETKLFQAIFSGLRADGATKQINRLLEASEAPGSEISAYAVIFTHIKWIIEARNLILHYGVTVNLYLECASDEVRMEFVSTNARVALRPSGLHEIPFSAEVLQQLIDDTSKVNALLFVKLYPEQGKEPQYTEIVQRAWRYKPPEQTPQER